MPKNILIKNYEIGVSGVLKELEKMKYKLDDRDNEIVSGKIEVDRNVLAKYRMLKNILRIVNEFI